MPLILRLSAYKLSVTNLINIYKPCLLKHFCSDFFIITPRSLMYVNNFVLVMIFTAHDLCYVFFSSRSNTFFTLYLISTIFSTRFRLFEIGRSERNHFLLWMHDFFFAWNRLL